MHKLDKKKEWSIEWLNKNILISNLEMLPVNNTIAAWFR